MPEAPSHQPARAERMWADDGIMCAVTCNPVGYWCGYAEVPVGHPWHGVSYTDPAPAAADPVIGDDMLVGEAVADLGVFPLLIAALGDDGVESLGRTIAGQVRVHGGVTFSGWKTFAGDQPRWWLGFDCCHGGDLPDLSQVEDPQVRAALSAFTASMDGHRWTMEEVSWETQRLAVTVRDVARSARR